MICYLGLDDFNPPHVTTEALEVFQKLVAYFPNFKATMFVSGGLPIPMNPYPDKIAYALHGWYHVHYDAPSDPHLQSWLYDRVYRAPYWELPKDLYIRLQKAGYKITLNGADKDEKREGYRWNWDIKNPPDLSLPVIFGHGHISATPIGAFWENFGLKLEELDYHVAISPNYIGTCWKNIQQLPKDTEFRFLRDL